jgi:hypothetical protein
MVHCARTVRTVGARKGRACASRGLCTEVVWTHTCVTRMTGRICAGRAGRTGDARRLRAMARTPTTSRFTHALYLSAVFQGNGR